MVSIKSPKSPDNIIRKARTRIFSAKTAKKQNIRFP